MNIENAMDFYEVCSDILNHPSKKIYINKTKYIFTYLKKLIDLNNLSINIFKYKYDPDLYYDLSDVKVTYEIKTKCVEICFYKELLEIDPFFLKTILKVYNDKIIFIYEYILDVTDRESISKDDIKTYKSICLLEPKIRKNNPSIWVKNNISIFEILRHIKENILELYEI